MHLEHLPRNFDTRRESIGLRATLHAPANPIAFENAETRIDHRIPDQIRAFYSTFNGLTIEDPPFEILPVDELVLDDHSRIHFATADRIHLICFDCSHLNEARQWDIVNPSTGDRITYTIASFWSNKMWKWVDRRLAFWQEDV